ncbi:MAG: glycosyltransferase [Lachnospira sp.]|nr:glycosyltransferase [Lachnospira sp.]
MNLSQKLIDIAESMRGVITKIIPMPVLRKAKDMLIESSIKKTLKESHIEPYVRGRYKEGINLIGGIRSEMGLGQSSRLVAAQIDNTGIEYTIKHYMPDFGTLRNGDHTWEHKISDKLVYDINIFHVQPMDMGYALGEFGNEAWNYRYNIGFWLWELEEFPKEWKKYIPLVDEIWTPSEFVSNCMRKVTDKPVTTVPYCVTAPTDSKYDRDYFKLPKDKFLFLAMYDTNSTMERKNPEGAVMAFKKAFAPDDDRVGLVLKMNNPRKEHIEKLEAMIGDYKNIYYINEVMDKIVVNSLIACVDVFVSLHRAEGFGLVMAEAMLNDTVCVTTNWSANTEFMNEEVACMVDYTFSVLQKTSEPYKKGSRWAEPNIDTAAGYMKRLVSDKVYYDDMAVKARAYVGEKLGMEAASKRVQERIEQIRRELR